MCCAERCRSSVRGHCPSATPGLPLFELRSPTLGWVQFQVKRLFDLIVGSLLLILSAPIVGLAALAIWIGDRGPAFYRAPRIGLNQRSFTCLKLRTMRVGSEAEQAALERENQADGPLFKIREDPRVTRVGPFLRRFSIDELPQLWNVLRGEMSLVGPRPLPERDFNQMDEVAKRRYVVLPGLTGLWQVSGRSDLSGDELVRLDMQYIEGWSLWTDIVIIARTVPVVLFGRGAY
jgi:lipopolysaccharide/colanic/teichoic acid biosynthesis glycosyltransferase